MCNAASGVRIAILLSGQCNKLHKMFRPTIFLWACNMEEDKFVNSMEQIE